MRLRDYQHRAIDMIYDWFRHNGAGNLAVDMPGGSGKSVVIGYLVKDIVTRRSDKKVLMLVHSKELISQNAKKLLDLWPDAPLGVYSASLNRRELGQSILYAGIQSVRNKAKQIGHIDVCIVDEAHSISNSETGTYRKLLADLTAINPSMRVIGFSASPYRLGQGLITDGDEALFSEIISPVSIKELVEAGHLVTLKTKHTTTQLDTSGLHKKGGEFIASEMEQKFNTPEYNKSVVGEIISRAAGCLHWLIFCSGIDHSESVAQLLRISGVAAVSLTSTASKDEREQILSDFESGKIRAVCNVGILTTGYDFPNLDCIAFLRATASPGLFLQMAVRGMRPKDHTRFCTVLDFVGNTEIHGFIDCLSASRVKKGDGLAPVKTCPECSTMIHASLRVCPECGYGFPKKEKEFKAPSTKELLSFEEKALPPMTITHIQFSRHKKQDKPDSVRMDMYEPGAIFPVNSEWLCFDHGGYAAGKARSLFEKWVGDRVESTDECLALYAGRKIPVNASITLKRNGKYFELVNSTILQQAIEAAA